ncbi:MAG TPA: proline racemase family protein [Vicinamibacterales bacterium]|nr:proline racemase family protein [Vicinamibacterales bacterium]
MKRINTIDAHVAGEAVRLIVGGGPSVPGRSMTEKLAWLRKHGDELRRLIMLEPRGHAGMHGAMLTEPVSSTAHAGLLFMHAAGFPALSGEGVIGAVTIALEQNLIAGIEDELRLDTPAGLIRAHPRTIQGATAAVGAKVASVAVTGVPSFVHSAGLGVEIGTREVTIDVAFGGEFYAIADGEAVGLPIEMANASQLIHMGLEIKEAVESSLDVAHPFDGRQKGIHGVIFTGAPRMVADLRSATVLDAQVLRRSPGVTGTAALLAVLDAMGLLTGDHPFTHEGVLGTMLQGRIMHRRSEGELAMVTPLIEGSASVTGFHEFCTDDCRLPTAD